MDESASEQSQSHQQDKRIWLAKDLDLLGIYHHAPSRAIARGTFRTEDRSRPGRGVRRPAASDTRRGERISQAGDTVSDRLRQTPRDGPLRRLCSEWLGTGGKPVLDLNENGRRLSSAEHTTPDILRRKALLAEQRERHASVHRY